ALERALELSPTSGVILRELAAVERERGDLDEALVHARGAVALDAADPEAHAMLASVLEARGDLAGAADAFARAASIDDRGGWARRSAELAGRAHLAALPPEMQTVADAPTISRAQAATLIGLRLEALLTAAPRRVTAVATDVRGHWAASWILPVTEAGVMEIFPNHTFQPSSPVRRSDLARIVNELLGLAAVSRPSDLARWRAATVRFVDLPATHLIYRAAATSVAAGAMTLDADRFQPTREVTGAELLAAVARIEQLADR
ncbi:MAG TPA: S-layer homology domain-containing protein, partial [Vicinamibacterales bacterium]|nr:S-layer homology domain-containing protein [Vicinamibacterales bacterium]